MAEYPQAYSESTPTARKEHKCCECAGAIRIGEKYHLGSGIWDGRAAAYKTCHECEQLRKELSDTIKDYDDRPGFGELREFIFECGEKFMRRFLENRRARGRAIPEWMEKRVAEHEAREKEHAA